MIISATNGGGTDSKTLVWTITKKPLTITGLTGVDKIYDATSSATLSGTPVLNTIVSGDDVSIAGSPTASFTSKTVGAAKTITVTGYTLGGTKAGNYTISQPTGLTANITEKTLTVTGATAQNKVYDGTTAATITGAALVGVISGDVVTVSGGGTFASANVNAGIAVTTGLSLAGVDSGNYTLTQPTGLTADITKANPVFTTSAIAVLVGGNYTLPSANVSSTSNGILSYSMIDNAAATLTRGNTINGIAVGTNILTVNQASSANYNAGNTTVGVNVSTYSVGDYQSINDGNWHSTASSGSINTWQQYDGTNWVNISNSPPSNSASLGTKTVYIKNSIMLVGNNTAPNVVIENDGILNTSTVAATFGNLRVKTGGTFNRKSSAGIKPLGNFEIEDGGNAYLELNSSPATGLSTSIWQGIEKFHANSNIYVTSTQNNGNYTIIPSINDITPLNNAYFGNLIIDKYSGNSIVLLPIGFSGIFTAGDLIFRNSNNDIRFLNSDYSAIINGDLVIDNTFTNRKVNLYAAATGTATITVLGNIIHNGNDNLNLGTTAGGTTNLNLKGDLIVGLNAKLISTTTTSSTINFIGAGDGTTDALTQALDVANQTTASNIIFNVNSGAYVKLINQDLTLGSNSKFNVLSGGTLDFGFNETTALNVVRVSTPTLSSGQIFDAQTGSTLKITSPQGITSAADYTGNVQIGASGKRAFASGLNTNYYYIGKVNQVTGNGLPTSSAIVAAPSRNVIVEMDDDALTLQASGVQRFNSSATLEIRKGIVVDDSFNNFSNSGLSVENGNLKMTGGRYRLNTSGIQPALKGVYDLSAGIIEFAKTGNPIQQIRGGDTYFYPHIEVTGKEVYHTSANINMKPNALFSVETDGMITATADSEQIISSDNANKATLELKDGAVFRTAAAEGFYGPADGINPTPSVRDNMLLELKPGSTVEYARSSEGGGLPQDVPDGNQNVTAVPSGYQNLKISGNGIKKAQGEITVNQMTNLTSVSATLTVPDYNEITNPVYSVFYALGGIDNTNATTGKFILGNDAIMLQNANAFNDNASIQVRRQFNLTNDRLDYNFLSSPVFNQNLKAIYGGDDLYVPFVTVLNESTNFFVNAKPADYAVQGKGFAVKEPILDYTGNTAIFKGKPNNGDDINIDITRFAINRGWNLIGNPYPSNLDLKAFYTENGSKMDNAEFRFWDNRVNKTYKQYGGNYIGYSYALFNAASGTNGAGNPAPGGDAGDNSGPLGSTSSTNELFRYVKVGQGFLIRAKDIGVTAPVSFKNNQRVTLQPSRGFFGKEVPLDDLFRLQLISSDELYLTQTVVYFNGGNNAFGIEDSKHPNSSSSDAFYSFADDQKTIINGRSSFSPTDVVNLGTNHFVAGNYKIRAIDKVGVFENAQSIYLKDKLLNTITDITTEAYNFESAAGQFTNRFEIVYEQGAVLATGTSNLSKVEVFREAADFVVRSTAKKIDNIEIYDAAGRLVLTLASRSKEVHFNSETLVEGMYILKISTEDGEQVTKKIRK